MHRIVRHTAFVTLLLTAALARGDEFFFKDGDRVVMIGDSITEQHLYSNYVELWTVTRFPAWAITFRNVGIGGDRSTGGNHRFQRDVLPYQPTALTVDFGMNDGGYRAFDEPGFKTYLGGLQGMADQAKQAGIRVAWITPQPLDTGDQGPTARTGYNLTLEKYSEGVQAIAEKNGAAFVDQFHPYLAVLDKARAAAPHYERITGGDAVHPGPAGQSLMAYAILKGLHFPRQVSSVEIDPVANDGFRASNCRITGLTREGDTIGFQRQDAALPFFPEEAKAILHWAPLLEELNEYTLKVAALKPGKYEIRLGGKKAAEHSAEELAKGVNLAAAALATGPVADQVKAVKAAVEAKNRFHHDRIFRGVVLAPVGQLPDWLGIKLTPGEIEAKRQAAYAERMAKMPELDAAVHKALESRPHSVEITPVTPQQPADKSALKPDVSAKITAALPDKPPAPPKQPRKVLIFTKTNGFRHGSIPVGVVSLTLMGEKTGAYTSVHSEDDAFFEPETLKQFDAVIMLNTTGDIFLPKQMPKDKKEQAAAREREARLKESLVDFVKSGKGLAGMHAATDTYHTWGEYNMMMGGTFAGHPWHTKVSVKNLTPGHPLNQMFSEEGFEINDEIYQFRGNTALPSERKMLLSLDTGKMDVSKGNRKDGLYPISWISTYGKGRTFYCSLGHRDEIYYNPGVLRHYLAGLQYVLGDLDADATPTAPTGK